MKQERQLKIPRALTTISLTLSIALGTALVMILTTNELVRLGDNERLTVTTEICTASDIHIQNDILMSHHLAINEELSEFITEIAKRERHTEDANCVLMVLWYSLQMGDAELATKYFTIYEELNENGLFASGQLINIMGVRALRAELSFVTNFMNQTQEEEAPLVNQ